MNILQLLPVISIIPVFLLFCITNNYKKNINQIINDTEDSYDTENSNYTEDTDSENDSNYTEGTETESENDSCSIDLDLFIDNCRKEDNTFLEMVVNNISFASNNELNLILNEIGKYVIIPKWYFRKDLESLVGNIDDDTWYNWQLINNNKENPLSDETDRMVQRWWKYQIRRLKIDNEYFGLLVNPDKTRRRRRSFNQTN